MHNHDAFLKVPVEGVEIEVYLQPEPDNWPVVWVEMDAIKKAFNMDWQRELQLIKSDSAFNGALLSLTDTHYLRLDKMQAWLDGVLSTSWSHWPSGVNEWVTFRSRAVNAIKMEVLAYMEPAVEDVDAVELGAPNPAWDMKKTLSSYLEGRTETSSEEILCYLGMENATAPQRRRLGKVLAELGFEDVLQWERQGLRLDLNSMQPGDRWVIEKFKDGHSMKRLEPGKQIMSTEEFIALLTNAGFLVLPPQVVRELRENKLATEGV